MSQSLRYKTAPAVPLILTTDNAPPPVEYDRSSRDEGQGSALAEPTRKHEPGEGYGQEYGDEDVRVEQQGGGPQRAYHRPRAIGHRATRVSPRTTWYTS